MCVELCASSLISPGFPWQWEPCRYVKRVHVCSNLLWHDWLRGAANGRHLLVIEQLVRFVICASPAFVCRVFIVAGQPAVHAEIVSAHGREIRHAVVVNVKVPLRPVQLKETHDGSCAQRRVKTKNTKTKQNESCRAPPKNDEQ